jgi:hypothetical protein
MKLPRCDAHDIVIGVEITSRLDPWFFTRFLDTGNFRLLHSFVDFVELLDVESDMHRCLYWPLRFAT